MKTLLLGGNASAKRLAEALLKEGHEVTLSVASSEGLTTVPPGARALVGRRDKRLWMELLQEEAFDVAIDGAHPFAFEAKEIFRTAAKENGLRCLALQRPSLVPPGALLASGPEEAAETATARTGEGGLVFLAVGVKLLDILVPLLRRKRRPLRARVLPTEESLARARRAGLEPPEIIALWGAPGKQLEQALLAESRATCLLCKDSGREGGMEAKAEAAAALSIPLIVIARRQDDPGALDDGTLLEKLRQGETENIKGRSQKGEKRS